MNSAILDMMGMGGIDPAIFIIILIVICIILFIIIMMQGSKIKKINKRINRFMAGSAAESLEEEIARIFKDNKKLLSLSDSNASELERLNNKLDICYRKLGIVRYDAFNQMGGKLSFAIALLNSQNNGFILNSVHSAEGSYVYTKEIYAGECELELGDEEILALHNALNQK